jgi:hypothetical protein
MDFVKAYRDYTDFLGISTNATNDQETAKALLTEELENIIAANGTGEMYENEIELCELLGINIERG